MNEFNKLLNRCIAINEQGDYHAFFEYSGHVNYISVTITKSDTKYSSANFGHEYREYCDISEAGRVFADLDKFLD